MSVNIPSLIDLDSDVENTKPLCFLSAVSSPSTDKSSTMSPLVAMNTPTTFTGDCTAPLVLPTTNKVLPFRPLPTPPLSSSFSELLPCFTNNHPKQGYDDNCNLLVEKFVRDLIVSVADNTTTVDSLTMKICKLAADLKDGLGQYFSTQILATLQNDATQTVSEQVDKAVNDYFTTRYQTTCSHQKVSNSQESFANDVPIVDPGDHKSKTVRKGNSSHKKQTSSILNIKSTDLDPKSRKIDDSNNSTSFLDNCLIDIYNDQRKTQKAIEAVDGCLTELTAAVTQNIGMALEGEIQVEILGQKLKSVEDLVKNISKTVENSCLQDVDQKKKVTEQFEKMKGKIDELSTTFEKRETNTEDMNMFETRIFNLENYLLDVQNDLEFLRNSCEGSIDKVEMTVLQLNKVEEKMKMLSLSENVIQNGLKRKFTTDTLNPWMNLVWKKLIELENRVGHMMDFLDTNKEDSQKLSECFENTNGLYDSGSTVGDCDFYSAIFEDDSPSQLCENQTEEFNEGNNNCLEYDYMASVNNTLRICNLTSAESLYQRNHLNSSNKGNESLQQSIPVHNSFSYAEKNKVEPSNNYLRVALAASDECFESRYSFYNGTAESNSSIICNFATPSSTSSFGVEDRGNNNTCATKSGDRVYNEQAHSSICQDLISSNVLMNCTQGLQSFEKLKSQNRLRKMTNSIQEALDLDHKLQCLEKTVMRQQRDAAMILKKKETSGMDVSIGYTAETITTRPISVLNSRQNVDQQKDDGSGGCLEEEVKKSYTSSTSCRLYSDHTEAVIGTGKSKLLNDGKQDKISIHNRGSGFQSSEFFKDPQPLVSTPQRKKLVRGEEENRKVLGHFNRNEEKEGQPRLRFQGMSSHKKKKKKVDELKVFENKDIENEEMIKHGVVTNPVKPDDDKLRHRLRPFFKRNKV